VVRRVIKPAPRITAILAAQTDLLVVLSNGLRSQEL
jgi:hypothetical protein